jgi:hypothetical protein
MSTDPLWCELERRVAVPRYDAARWGACRIGGQGGNDDLFCGPILWILGTPCEEAWNANTGDDVLTFDARPPSDPSDDVIVPEDVAMEFAIAVLAEKHIDVRRYGQHSETGEEMMKKTTEVENYLLCDPWSDAAFVSR